MDSLESILLVGCKKNKKQAEGDTTAKNPSRMNTGAVRRNLFFLVFFVKTAYCWCLKIDLSTDFNFVTIHAICVRHFDFFDKTKRLDYFWVRFPTVKRNSTEVSLRLRLNRTENDDGSRYIYVLYAKGKAARDHTSTVHIETSARRVTQWDCQFDHLFLVGNLRCSLHSSHNFGTAHTWHKFLVLILPPYWVAQGRLLSTVCELRCSGVMAATSFSKASSRQTGGTNRGPSKSRPSDGKSRGHNNVGPSLSQQLQQNQSKREIVGNYSIQKKLGVGTFGEVRLAIHIPTGRIKEHISLLDIQSTACDCQHFWITLFESPIRAKIMDALHILFMDNTKNPTDINW